MTHRASLAGPVRALTFLAFLGIALAAPVAGAQSPAPAPAETGKMHFDRGVKLYNLGHFQESIGEFEKAYDLDPAPILLFNIAQSHRQIGNKDRALFFYRRYLEQAPNANNRADVEQRMKDLTQSLEQEKELKQRPPTEVERAGGASVPVSGSATPAGAPAGEAVPGVAATSGSTAAPGTPRWIVAAEVAPSLVGFSGRDVNAPVLFTIRVGGAYVLPVWGDRLRVGCDGIVSFLPYTDVADASKATSSLWGFLLTAAYAQQITPAIVVGGGLGAGVIWWAGLKAGNPFTVEAVAASGAIPMPTFQAGLRVDYLIGRGLFLELAPEFLVSETTSAGLSDSVSAVDRFDINIGAGYAF